MKETLLETGQTSAMIFTILIGAITLNNLVIFSGLANALADFVSGLDMSPATVMLIILLMYLIMGCFLDALAMILLTVPIFYPIVLDLGYDPIWFGIIVVMVVELGLITPPIGMNVFVIKGMAQSVPLVSIYKGVLPFVIGQVVLIIAVFLIPEIARFGALRLHVGLPIRICSRVQHKMLSVMSLICKWSVRFELS